MGFLEVFERIISSLVVAAVTVGEVASLLAKPFYGVLLVRSLKAER